MQGQENNVSNIVADRRSVAAGRDVTVGDGNRVALRDYHEHNSEISEHDAEWGPPPAGIGLILCPRCRRRHIAQEAVACGRCGYPQRETMMAKVNAVRARLQFEQALRNLCCLACAMPPLWHGVLHRSDAWHTFICAALSGALGYVVFPAAWRLGRRWWRGEN